VLWNWNPPEERGIEVARDGGGVWTWNDEPGEKKLPDPVIWGWKREGSETEAGPWENPLPELLNWGWNGEPAGSTVPDAFIWN